MAEENSYEVTPYRWVVLGVYMAVGALTQVMWINFAAINSASASFYSVTTDDIDLLSMIFMLVYIALAIPSAWVIDVKGFKVGAGIGAVLTGVFGFLRMFSGTNYALVFVFQTGIAVGQPFVLNAVSKLAATWFPEGERAVAAGIGTMAIFLGVFLGMLLPPFILDAWGFESVLTFLGVVGLAITVLFMVLVKDHPEKPPGPAAVEEKTFVKEGIKQLVHNRDFLILMAIVFIGLGSFNAIATWIESVVTPKGYGSIEAGVTGAIIVLGGIFGAMVISGLSDKFRKRKVFLLLSLVVSTPLLLAIVFVTQYTALLVVSFTFGFFLMSALPIMLEFAAEQTAPIPEGTSNGILMMMGQIGGVVFIVGFLGVTNMTFVLVFLDVLLAVALVLGFMLKEKPLDSIPPASA
ncbi:MAG: MFS transporter [Promethearchaeota archaeon]